MTMMVQATTDQVPELATLIEQRRAHGLDRFDEWWEGVYRIVTGPSREHGRLIAKLCILMDPLVDSVDLELATPINVGVDKRDARVPDIGVVRRDTPMTSPAFHSTAELVVEVLSPGEPPGAKLGFYAAWNVSEYLEVDLPNRSCRLLRYDGGDWHPTTSSEVIDLHVDDVARLLTHSF